eukprot:3207188-Lingulodinium_polyedra.AAC.1
MEEPRVLRPPPRPTPAPKNARPLCLLARMARAPLALRHGNEQPHRAPNCRLATLHNCRALTPA